MNEPAKKIHQVPEGYSPKAQPEILKLAKEAQPTVQISDAPAPFLKEFKIFQLPASRVIGFERRYPLHGDEDLPAQLLWGEAMDSAQWKELLALPQIIPGSSLGWTCDYIAEDDTFSYIACVLCPADTPVPEGCQYRDVPPTDVAGGLWGDEISKVVKRLKKLGYITKYETEGCGWNAELYLDEEQANPPPKPNKVGCRWLVPCKKEERK